MSFADLPNETFDDVIGLLPHSDVNSLSLVSKGFRAAAEPHLYRNLVLNTNRRHLIRWLLLTLLHRPELAAHIKTIRLAGTKALLGASEAIPPPGSERLYEYLEEESTQNSLRKMVLEICGSGLNMAAARISWMGGVLATNHLDGSLAMLACMAVNIESITLESRPDYDDCFEGQYVGFMMNGMNAVLGDVLRMSYVPGPQIRRLGSLKALHVDTKGWINLFVVPSLESIRIAMSYRLQWETIGRNTKLRELEVVRACVDPAFNLGEPFKNEVSPNLARIVYRKLHYRPELAAAPQQLVDLMIVNCPGLVEFEFSFESYEFHLPPLQKLNQLSALRTLRIDVHLLVASHGARTTLVGGTYVLPPKLSTLLLTKICKVDFNQLVAAVSESRTEVMRYISPMLHVKELAWVLPLMHTSEEHLQNLQYLHTLAIELKSKFDTNFKAYDFPSSNLEVMGPLRVDKDGIWP